MSKNNKTYNQIIYLQDNHPDCLNERLQIEANQMGCPIDDVYDEIMNNEYLKDMVDDLYNELKKESKDD